MKFAVVLNMELFPRHIMGKASSCVSPPALECTTSSTSSLYCRHIRTQELLRSSVNNFDVLRFYSSLTTKRKYRLLTANYVKSSPYHFHTFFPAVLSVFFILPGDNLQLFLPNQIGTLAHSDKHFCTTTLFEFREILGYL
jgi:hypothetical protein